MIQPPAPARRGYSMIELLAVLAILSVLATMVLPVAETLRQREREAELKRSLWEIRDALDRWREAAQSGAIVVPSSRPPYPPDLLSLEKPWADARADHRGEVLRFLRRIPRDPFADANLAADQSWGLRSYLSEAENPRPGDDVYDVYSLSNRIGSDGSPLRSW